MLHLGGNEAPEALSIIDHHCATNFQQSPPSYTDGRILTLVIRRDLRLADNLPAFNTGLAAALEFCFLVKKK